MMEKRCPACEMPFDWAGVEEDGEEYCCDGCASGLPCTCPQHDHAGTGRRTQRVPDLAPDVSVVAGEPGLASEPRTRIP